MYNSFYHSAEGSHWTKKNHKYIRKEGNRYIYPEDIKRSAATYTQNSQNYRQLSKQHANREAAKSGKVVNPSIKFTNNAGDISFRVNTNRSFPSNTVSDYKQYSREMAVDRNRANAKNGIGAKNQQYAKSVNARQAALRDQQKEVNELKRMDARDNQRSADYKQLSADKAKASASKKINTANSSQEYAKSLSQKNRQKLNRTSAANGSTTDYKALSYQHRQNDPETKNRADEHYKTLQKQAANRKKAANGDYVNYKEASYEHRKNDPKLKTRQDSHYKGLVNRQNRQAENRAKAANGKTVDYKELSKQHADSDELIQRNKKRHAQEEMFKEGKRKDATRNQATPDYKYMSELNKAKTESTPEAQKAKRKKHKKENRREFGKNVVNKLMKYNKAMFLGGNTSKNTADRYIHNENSKKSKHH